METDFLEKVKSLSSKTSVFKSLEVKLNYDHQLLLKDSLDAIKKFGLFQSRLSTTDPNEKIVQNYLSASLTHNPNSKDQINSNPHASTLGSTLISNGSYANSIKWEGRDNYTDTLSFKERTPFSQHGHIGHLMDGFSRTLIRSRLSMIKSGEDLSHYQFNWHNDESIFLNLRINIPLITSKEYELQILIPDYETDNVELNKLIMREGYAYIYNTELPHRPICTASTNIDRINLICGISPWFDFIPESNSWVSNEFYGKLHPFEIFHLGYCNKYFASKNI